MRKITKKKRKDTEVEKSSKKFKKVKTVQKGIFGRTSPPGHLTYHNL